MENKQAQQPDNSDHKKRYRVEKDRMDYEGGNWGDKGPNEKKTKKEDVDTDDSNPRPKVPEKPDIKGRP